MKSAANPVPDIEDINLSGEDTDSVRYILRRIPGPYVTIFHSNRGAIMYIPKILVMVLGCTHVMLMRTKNYLLLQRARETDIGNYTITSTGNGGHVLSLRKAESAGCIPPQMFRGPIRVKRYSGGLAVPIYPEEGAGA